MAACADHEGLAFALSHQTDPGGPVGSSWPVEVGEFVDMVDLQPYPSLAELAPSGHEPVDQLIAFDGRQGWLSIGDDGGGLLFERDPAKRATSGILPRSRCTIT